jgi:flavin-dependent dehydrogenase
MPSDAPSDDTGARDPWDVIVVGGGPGGSATATLLARRGWRVLCCERARFPRAHVGESLLPASLPILDALGVLEAVEREGFVEKPGATMVWGRDAAPWSWYFRETNRTHPHAYQVWRPRFDQLLLDNARAAGVAVREDCRVGEVLFDGERAIGVRIAGESEVQRARFVVDASGQSGLIARAQSLRRYDDAFRNLAVYAYHEGAAHLPPPDAGNIFIESTSDGWCWTIPLGGGRNSVGAVVDSARGQQGITELGTEGFYEAQLGLAPRTAALLAGAERVDGPHVARDWSYVAERLAGEAHVLVGDAACFVDPLFSSGVHLALSSAVLASAYVTTSLRRPEMGAAAAAVYAELYLQQYGHFRELARLFYASNRTVESYFWEARRILGDEEAGTPREAFVRAVAGQPPQGYERVVLERGDAPAGFAGDVRSLESDRAGRRRAWDRALAGGRPPAALLTAVPRPSEGVRVERKPVLEGGEFVWGDVLVSGNRPEGTPISPLVARLLAALDGRRDLSGALESVVAGLPADRAAQLGAPLLATLGILYVDGVIDGLDAALDVSRGGAGLC